MAAKSDVRHPINIFIIAVHTSPGTTVLADVVLGEVGHDRKIMRTDPANIFLITVGTLPTNTTILAITCITLFSQHK